MRQPTNTTQANISRQPRHLRRERGRLAALPNGVRIGSSIALIALSCLGLGGLATSALLADSETVGANTFTTGTVDITTNPTTAMFTASSMIPGDKVTAPITVTNAVGSIALVYSMASTTTNVDGSNLAAQLVLTVRTGVSSCTNANFTSSGAQLYAGILGSTGGTNIIGNPATGIHATDRNLAVGGAETLCFQVSLPLSTTNTYSGKTTTASLVFSAEQAANNPAA